MLCRIVSFVAGGIFDRNMRIPKPRIAIIFFFIVSFFSLSYASVNIPLDSSFYTDIDTLISQGLIKSSISSTRPFTRDEAGRLLAEAVDYSKIDTIPFSFSKVLNRMVEDYDEEISEARIRGSAPGTFIKPLDEFSMHYNFLNGPFSMFNNEGINYFDGSNAIIQFQSRARLWKVFSFYIQPLYIYNQKYQGIEGNDETEFTIHKGYVKFTIDNFEIEWGKDSLWWGPGYHGALLISNNARPFEMIKISNPRATLLPWIFRYLGPFRYTLLYSTLDDKAISEHPPNSELSGLRFDFKPHPFFEFGMSYLAHCGGDRPGIENLDLSDYLYILFSSGNRNGDNRDSNKEFAIDAALTLPNLTTILPIAHSLKLYAEWGGEDEATLPYKNAYLLGMVFNDIFLAQGLQLRAEYADLSPKSAPGAWYSHGWWAMKYHGRVFGHHAGTDSDDLFIELSHTIKDSYFYKVSFDKERNGISKENTQEKYQYFLETGYNFKKWSTITLGYCFEQINNVENVKDRKEKNHFIGTELRFRF
jgi:hypothetical protein